MQMIDRISAQRLPAAEEKAVARSFCLPRSLDLVSPPNKLEDQTCSVSAAEHKDDSGDDAIKREAKLEEQNISMISSSLTKCFGTHRFPPR